LRFVSGSFSALSSDQLVALRDQIEERAVSHVGPLRDEYSGLASMLADPPELSGKCVRFLVVIKDQRGEVERARARVWTDGNIEWYRNMNKNGPQALAIGLLVEAVEVGDVETMPGMMEVEGH
jgi:hypothetical protein